ncbi:MAG: hypothetical protein H0V17_24995 [Deltaproteobacteria bacterium]|nr:hypothetical protein [Deltaproteobacteria bacterium]
MHWCLAALLALTACTEPRSQSCKQVCKREAECIEETGSKMPFEEKECVAACAALEQDSANSGAKVQRHIDCVRKQTTCAAVLECK